MVRLRTKGQGVCLYSAIFYLYHLFSSLIAFNITRYIFAIANKTHLILSAFISIQSLNYSTGFLLQLNYYSVVNRDGT
jgi:hypothetical protein